MAKSAKAVLQETATLANSAALVIFSKTPCPYCREAKELLQSEIGDRYSEVKIYFLDKMENGAIIQEALFALTGQKTVPNIFIQGKSIGGCSDLKALREASALRPLLSKAGLLAVTVGSRIPNAKVQLVTWSAEDKAWKITPTETGEFFRGKKVVMFGVPAAYSPSCSEKHLPGYVTEYAKFAERGVDAVVCLGVNDGFVMRAWASLINPGGKVIMMSDGNGELTRMLGLLQDSTAGGMGWRGRRFAMLVNDGVVREVVVEKPRTTDVSTAQAILPLLSKL